MSNQLCSSILENIKKANAMVTETIEQFSKDQWTMKGVDILQTPWALSMHIIECLDHYFRDDPNAKMQWGKRFGSTWWEMPIEDCPSAAAMLDYLHEIEERIDRQFTALSDEDLLEPFDEDKRFGETRLGHYIYAMRHTMQHQGVLSLLSMQAGNKPGNWA